MARNEEERFFFWFNEDSQLMKIYDRKYEKDYDRYHPAFLQVFKVVITKLSSERCNELFPKLSDATLKRLLKKELFRRESERK